MEEHLNESEDSLEEDLDETIVEDDARGEFYFRQGADGVRSSVVHAEDSVAQRPIRAPALPLLQSLAIDVEVNIYIIKFRFL